MHHLFSLHLISVLCIPEPSLCDSFRLALFTTLDWDVSPSYTLSYVSIRCFRSLNCIPLKVFRVFLKCHEEFSWASILQSFRDTRSLWGSWVQLFFSLWEHCLVLAWRTSKPSMPPCQYSARRCRGSRGGPV